MNAVNCRLYPLYGGSDQWQQSKLIFTRFRTEMESNWRPCAQHGRRAPSPFLLSRRIKLMAVLIAVAVSLNEAGGPIQPMQLLLKYDSELALHRSCCRSSKQDGSVSSGTWHGLAIRKTRPEPYIRRFAGYPRTGGAAQDVHVAPGYGPWKQTFSRSIAVWTQPGDSLRTENDGSNSWKRLRSSQGHARDDDDVSSDGVVQSLSRCC